MKNILLLGAAGKTGIPYSRLLLKEGYQVFGWDQKIYFPYPDDIEDHKNFSRVSLEAFQDQTILDQIDVLTLTPGIPLQQTLVQQAKIKGISILSEIDFCAPYLKQQKWIGITGTDGKSTVVSLTNHILKHLEQDSISCGNIGTPFSEVILQQPSISSKILVAELSSYQLEIAEKLFLDTSVLLNIAPDHLNRYKSYEDYASVKCSVADKTKNDTEGTFITSKEVYQEYFEDRKAQLPNSLERKFNIILIDELSSPHFSWNKQSEITYILYDKRNKREIITSKDITLAGKHNLRNILFALEIAYETLNKAFNKKIEKKLKQKNFWADALRNFTPLQHRFEIVQGKHPNITYINDSKATTSQAVLNAIRNIPSGSYLFMGGQGKGEDYFTLAHDIAEKKIKLFLFGEEKNLLKQTFDKAGLAVMGVFHNLEESIRAAHKIYEKDTSICTTFLLSPACTSWDAYRSFEERGNHFKQLVR